jgi:hypothetical protein
MFIAAEFHRNSANIFSRPVWRVVLNIFFDNNFFGRSLQHSTVEQGILMISYP